MISEIDSRVLAAIDLQAFVLFAHKWGWTDAKPENIFWTLNRTDNLYPAIWFVSKEDTLNYDRIMHSNIKLFAEALGATYEVIINELIDVRVYNELRQQLDDKERWYENAYWQAMARNI